MASIAFVLSHLPIPRLLKRIDVASDCNLDVHLVFWDRGRKELKYKPNIPLHKQYSFRFTVPVGNKVRRIAGAILYAAFTLKRLLRIRPQIIHTGNLDMLFIASTYKLLFHKNVQIIYEIGDIPDAFISDSKRLTVRALIGMEQILLRLVTRVILTSPGFWSSYYKYLLSKEKVSIILNVPVKRLFEKRIPGDRHLIPQNSFVIGYIGMIRHKKQLIQLVQATAEMNGVHILFAGGGPEFKELKEYCEGMRRVSFFGPYDYAREIAQLYAQVDCVFAVYDTRRPNVKVALPNRLYEAIQSAKPILVAKGTLLASFVDKHEIGLSINPNDIEEYKHAIAILKSNRLRFIRNCRKIQSQYTWENEMSKLADIYNELGRGLES